MDARNPRETYIVERGVSNQPSMLWNKPWMRECTTTMTPVVAQREQRMECANSGSCGLLILDLEVLIGK